MNDLSPITYNRYIKFVDLHLCQYLHHPIFNCGVIFLLTCIIQYSSFPYLMDSEGFLFVEDYYFDIISMCLNLLFIVRFQIYIKFPIFVEVLLFIGQNLGCYYLSFNEVSIINEDTNLGLKICLLAQILFPYLLLIMNILDLITTKKHNIGEEKVSSKYFDEPSEVARNSDSNIVSEIPITDERESEKSKIPIKFASKSDQDYNNEKNSLDSSIHTTSTVTTKTSNPLCAQTLKLPLFNRITTLLCKYSGSSKSSRTKSHSPFHHFIQDCNNNYLPIFISHSFLLVNDNFAFYTESSYFPPSLIYKLAQYSLKIYCIYQFILYEVASIFYGIEDITDYSIFYVFDSYNSEKTTRVTSYACKNLILVCTCMLVLLVDVAYIYKCYSF